MALATCSRPGLFPVGILLGLFLRREPEKIRLSFIYPDLRFVLIVAVPAIYGFIATGLERHFGFFSALRADRWEHLARATAHATTTAATSAAKPLGSSVLPAGRASLGFIGIALGCKELLFFDGEGEGFSTITTR
jgi:hypothetical protein